MPKVLALARRVEPDAGAELLAVGADGHLARLGVVDPEDRELLAPGEPERLAALAGRNWSGSTPIISRFERWIRSYDSAITARTPSRFGPFAAQSRDEPEPYSLPASTIVGTPSAR